MTVSLCGVKLAQACSAQGSNCAECGGGGWKVKVKARAQGRPSSLQDYEDGRNVQVSVGSHECASGIVLGRQAFWDRIEACCGDTAAAQRSLPLPFWSDFDCGCSADSVSSCFDAFSAAVSAVPSRGPHPYSIAFDAKSKPEKHTCTLY